MIKALAITMAVAFLSIAALSPVYAGGDKNHGDVGQGEVDQGDSGCETGNAQGDDAQDNQAD